MKNRILSIILALVFIMLPAGQAVYADDANDAPSLDDFGYYCVYNADQLYWTVKHFSSDMKIRIMNDIVVNEGVMTKESTDARIWVPIGGYDYNFIGEIDGMGHTISGLYCPDGKYAAFVGINYGSIRDLGIINSYFCAIPESVQNVAYAYAGTFCAAMKQNAILENCYSLDNIIAGNCIAGGLAGIADSSSSIIRNSYSSSSVSSVQSSTNSSRRKWADPLVYTTTAQLINVFWDSSKITKNYNTSIKDYAFTPEQAATGEITYKLNENGIYDVWRQNLNIDGVDNDPYPLQSTAHYKVYCDDGIYTNHADDPDVYDPGSGEENLGDVEMNADGYYEIYNENHLYQFAQLVNENADKKNANAVLMRDIVLHTDKIVEMGFYNTWTPIGNINAPYLGEFDGQGHIISGMYGASFDYEMENSGLFGCIGSGADIKNLGIVNSYIYAGINSTATPDKAYAGAIAAMTKGGSITNCFARDNTIISEAYAGGLVGKDEGNTKLKNCFCVRSYVAGNEKYSAGGVTGSLGAGSSAEECYYFRVKGGVNVDFNGILALEHGDVDLNGSVDILDAISANYLIFYDNENALSYYTTDFDENGMIEDYDIQLIMRSASGLELPLIESK